MAFDDDDDETVFSDPVRLRRASASAKVGPTSAAIDRTSHAQTAALFTARFEHEVAGRQFDGFQWRIAPPEETTGQGTRARQPLILVGASDGEEKRLAAGWVNALERQAELHGWAHIAAQHRQRHHDLPPLSEENFGDLRHILVGFFETQKIELCRSESRPRAQSREGSPPAPERWASPWTLLLAAAFFLALGAVVSLFFVRGS